MDVVKTIKPGDPGSLKYLRRFGEKLVAVRYRKAADERYIHTTVEVIQDTREYCSGVNHAAVNSERNREWVAVRINYEETVLRYSAKKGGARWSRLKKVWVMEYRQALELGLTERIIPGLGVQCSDVDLLV